MLTLGACTLSVYDLGTDDSSVDSVGRFNDWSSTSWLSGKLQLSVDNSTRTHRLRLPSTKHIVV